MGAIVFHDSLGAKLALKGVARSLGQRYFFERRKGAFFIEAGAAVGGRGPLSLSSFDTVIAFGNSHEFMIQISYCHPVFESPLEISSL